MSVTDKKTGSRYYDTPGGKMWSVTTILGIIDKSGPLTYWAAKCAAIYVEETIKELRANQSPLTASILHTICENARREFRNVKQTAADKGTEVHDFVERWCKAKIAGKDSPSIPTLDSQVNNACNLFLQWAETVKLTPMHSELFVFHPLHEYAGTTDIVASGLFNKRWKKPRNYLLDIKTSKAVYETQEMQDAAYSEAFRANLLYRKIPIEGEGIIRIGKEDGKPEFVDCSDRHDHNFECFLAAKNLYLLMKGRPK